MAKPKKKQQPKTAPKPPDQESYEQELRDLQAKARSQTRSKSLADELYQALLGLRIVALLVLVAGSSAASQLALSPVYGSIPASIFHNYVVWAACFVGWCTSALLNEPAYLLPVIACYIPTVQFFLFKLSSALTAYWGPPVTEALTIFPLITVSAACVAQYWQKIDLSRVPGLMRDIGPPLVSLTILNAAGKYINNWLATDAAESVVKTRMGSEMVLAALYAASEAASTPATFVALTIPSILHFALWNTHVHSPSALTSLNSTLTANNWTILDRKESVTGYLSVIESLDQGFRVMRCDHSLLGGEWVKIQRMPQFKDNQVGETIYGVFTMLEAVRLVKMPKPIVDRNAKALVIGMGIGTTPAALVAHGIDTTVVEIDPVVSEFAAKYFKLPTNVNTVIEDAVSYTNTLANRTEGRESFDYIIHDVFTGGAEPIPLFTLEFLQNLETLLKPGGVIAINYAGDFALPPPGVVVRTIRKVFPSCRVFREHEHDASAAEKSGSDFDNIVIFCTKLADSKIAFRDPTQRDLLNSPARQGFLVPQHEVTEKLLSAGDGAGILTSNDTDKLARWHQESALGHWAIMRVVLPAFVWENW